jgi:hypothetical protein
MIVMVGVLTGCTSSLLPRGMDAAPISDAEMQRRLMREGTSLVIDEAIRNGRFAPTYAGIYNQNGRVVVLVTDRQHAVHAFLVEHRIPESAFEVRMVDDTLVDLERAKVAAARWIDAFSDTGAVLIDIEQNQVVIAADRQSVVMALGYDPGATPIPYDQWPESLKAALKGMVPGVDVELRAGFSVQVRP